MGHHTGRPQQTGGMTTESETPPPTGQDRILLRQANPLVVRNGKAQKGLFRIDTDPETSERAISVELASPEYSGPGRLRTAPRWTPANHRNRRHLDGRDRPIEPPGQAGPTARQLPSLAVGTPRRSQQQQRPKPAQDLHCQPRLAIRATGNSATTVAIANVPTPTTLGWSTTRRSSG